MNGAIVKFWNADSALLLVGAALGALAAATVDGYGIATAARFAFVWLAEPFREVLYFGSFCG
jgi:hypothetical protein